jgi:hypothetical protein
MSLIATKSVLEHDRLVWFKASFSNQDSACVEVACLPQGGMAVRDSKNPAGPACMFSSSAWARLLDAVRAERH